MQTVEYSCSGERQQVRVLYLTNRQASSIHSEHFPELMRAMKIPEPKLVIRLTRSLYGKAHLDTRSAVAKKCAENGFCIPLPELNEEDAQKTEMALSLFVKERLLPVAMRTTALVIAYDTCSLGTAFGRDCASVQKSMGSECPFTLLYFCRSRRAPALTR